MWHGRCWAASNATAVSGDFLGVKWHPRLGHAALAKLQTASAARRVCAMARDILGGNGITGHSAFACGRVRGA